MITEKKLVETNRRTLIVYSSLIIIFIIFNDFKED